MCTLNIVFSVTNFIITLFRFITRYVGLEIFYRIQPHIQFECGGILGSIHMSSVTNTKCKPYIVCHSFLKRIGHHEFTMM